MSDDGGFGLPFVVREVKQQIEDVARRIDQHVIASASKAEVAFLSTRLDNVVPRSEHVLRWKYDDERYDKMSDKIDRLDAKVEQILVANIPDRLVKVEATLSDLPGKLLRTVALIVTIAVGVTVLATWLTLHFHL